MALKSPIYGWRASVRRPSRRGRKPLRQNHKASKVVDAPPEQVHQVPKNKLSGVAYAAGTGTRQEERWVLTWCCERGCERTDDCCMRDWERMVTFLVLPRKSRASFGNMLRPLVGTMITERR